MTGFLIVSAFVLLDVVTGFVFAIKSKTVSSSKMRAGLWGKGAELALYGVAAALEAASAYLDLGFNFPVSEAVAVYIVAMESVSVIENLVKVNPELTDNPIFSILKSDISPNGDGAERDACETGTPGGDSQANPDTHGHGSHDPCST